MTTTHLGSKLWVVLNSNRLVTELYAKKGNITNERPPYPIANTILSRGGDLSYFPLMAGLNVEN